MPKLVDKEFLRELRETWSEVTTAGMTEQEADKFSKYKKAVDMYIDGVSVDVIADRMGIKKSRIYQLVSRCATPTNTGEIPGYSALVPYNILLTKKTKMEIFFEQYPKIGEKIKGVYFGDKKYTSEHRPNLRTLHGIFIRECRNAGVQADEFPFDLQDYGYERLRIYINNLRDTEMNKAIRREGKDQMQKFLSTGFGKSISINPRTPYDIVQIDGHILDVLTVVNTTDINGEVITDIATRMWLIAVIDVATRCIIGYSVSPHMNYNQFDVLEAIKNSIVPHEHKEFKLKSLPYPEKGGFPSEVIPEARWAAFNTIMLDNAKSHLATKVVSKLTNDLGCVMNFGSVATPETRGIVERVFRTLENSVHQIPSTTGSNVRDLKRKDPEKNAAKLRITYEDVCEILESLIAEYNNSAHSSLNGYTPLEAMSMKLQESLMPVYTVPQRDREKVLSLTHFMKECTLRGGYESGKQLRISFMGCIYTSSSIRIPMSMRGEKVLIEVNPEDLRTVKMFRKDGTYFCDMTAQGEYGRIPHSLKTRRMSNKARRERMTPDSIFNPDISRLTEELTERGKKDRRSRTKAATIVREAKGALDHKGSAEIIDLYPAEQKAPPARPLRKVVGENSRDKRTLTAEETQAIIDKYPGDIVSAMNEINRLSRGG